ncbi:Vestitone reductase [Linum perenne]
MAEVAASKTLCVTGGTSFIGSWLIKALLHRGYSVHATIRPHHQPSDITFLTDLPGAKQRLKTFHADLNNPETYSAAIRGCSGVYHVATPMDFERKESVEEIVMRSVEGAMGIVKACVEEKSVKRVVYTSSASTVGINGEDDDVEVVDESFWTDVEYVRSLDSNAGSYVISKTLTERKLTEFADENGLELVTVIPTFVVGPFICNKFPSSIRTALGLVIGTLGDKNQYPVRSNLSMVHVDDVARAHIFLMENPHVTKGRFICSSHAITLEQMHQLIHTRYPDLPLPTLESLKEHVMKGRKEPRYSSKKLMDVGFEYKYGLEDIFDGAIQSCRENGYM